MAWPKTTVLAFLSYGAILAATELVPVLKDFKVFDWHSVFQVMEFTSRRQSSSPVEDEEVRLRPTSAISKMAVTAIRDTGNDLDHFFEKLRLVEKGDKKAVVRITHYGDSPTTADMITADARVLLQKQFGDAGHGFCLIAKPWAWYEHRGLDVKGEGWVIDPANQSTVKDGLYGLGGVSFRGGPGAFTRIRLKDGSHRRIEVAYLQQPNGGAFSVSAGDTELGTVETEGPKPTSGFAAFDIPEHANTFFIRVVTGNVRLFGASFERDEPGVIYNSLGVNGAYVNVLSRMFRADHLTEQLRHYQPDLVIINYGTNESVYPQFLDSTYENEVRESIRRVRLALPESSILMMSPMDRGERKSSGEIGTVPAIPRLVAIQARVAEEMDVAFFNTFDAMGGQGTMGRWFEAEPRLVGADFIHPMPGGARIVGNLLYQGILDGYNKYKLRHMREQMQALNH
jgi:lysophospholipase L1-like esterase